MSPAKAKAKPKDTILIADDESGIRDVFVEMIDEIGYRAVAAKNAEEAHELVLNEHIKMAFIDIWMPPGIDGIELLKRWKEQGVMTFPVAIVSGYAEVQSTVEAMKLGAIDVIAKPVERKRIHALVRKTMNQSAGEKFTDSINQLQMGKSVAINKLKGELLKAADGDGAILLTGPPARCCEFFGMLLHNPGKPWLRLNDCKTLETDPIGRLAENKNGTVYIVLPETLSPNQQRGLYQLIRNADGHNVRVICEAATSLEEMKASGSVNDELAKVMQKEVAIPPLEEFVSDLPALLQLAAQRLAFIDGRPQAQFSPESLESLTADNARWIDNGLEALLSIARLLLRNAQNGTVGTEQVHKLLFVRTPSEGLEEGIFDNTLRDARNHFEKMYFKRLLERSDHNISKASQLSSLDRAYLYRKIKSLLGQDALRSE